MDRGCLGALWAVSGVVRGCAGCLFVSEEAQVELRSARV